ncbi:MAG: 50S ribosomal protein L22 [Candidatus Phytoplasma cynodontis]|uniref:50S ribosomal protein L22 n=1 Tax='Cynodon dactylon' phytoplasma TaxID=295320 RepID=UPI001265D4B9|nr:50S ribosomal protein L22 ['Cynodon dactylon' phytoplasma]KAB8121982.1 50S ribosomal protein L22 ['Cynodon dactylon' phytoplasma]WIA07604.1 MAG: 50S ribosomal protein L22 [Candidatus Phytoplasma cynodontis]
MNIKAIANKIPITPRKVRLVIDLVRGKRIKEAQSILMFTRKTASSVVLKLLKSAVANAVHNYKFNEDDLYINQIFVNEGLRLTRFFPRAKGKTDKIKKRTSHITISVSSVENKNKEINNGSKK